MAAKWGICVFMIGLFALVGCRTPQPVLKPDKSPEVLRTAPTEARYDESSYPKQAFAANEDPSKRFSLDSKGGAPTRGAMAPGAGAVGGMGGGGGQR